MTGSVDSLVVTFVGMKTQYVKLLPDKDSYRIRMEYDVEEMQEVVVTGYQTINRKRSTGAITSVNAEIFNYIAVRLKNESPYTRTMMATITNGTARSGYIPNDAAYGFQTFEVLSSRLKPGYAESAIVNGLLDLINEATH